MSYTVLLSVLERAYAFHQSDEAGRIVEEIWSCLKDVYSDIAQAHFASARAALAAARESREPEQEVRGAIAHLRDTFHIYQALLNKTRKERYLFFFEDEVPLLSYQESLTVNSGLFELALCVAANYADLGEPTNARCWKKEAEALAHAYIAAKTAHLDAQYLYSINKDLVIVRREESEITTISSYRPRSTYTTYVPTTEGARYLAAARKKVEADVKRMLEAPRFQ